MSGGEDLRELTLPDAAGPPNCDLSDAATTASAGPNGADAPPPTPSMPSLRDIVRVARIEQHGMSQAAFAAAVGLSQGVVASIEYGGRPSQPVVEKLARFLQRPVNELDPDGSAIKRRAARPREARVDLAFEAAASELLEQLVVLHAEFCLAHERAVAAVRANDIQALTAARSRQAEILAEQGDCIDAYLAARPGAPLEGARSRAAG